MIINKQCKKNEATSKSKKNRNCKLRVYWAVLFTAHEYELETGAVSSPASSETVFQFAVAVSLDATFVFKNLPPLADDAVAFGLP